MSKNKSLKQSLQKRAEEASITVTVNGKSYDLGSKFVVTEGNEQKTRTARAVVLDDGTIFISTPFQSDYIVGMDKEGNRQGTPAIKDESALDQSQQDAFDQWVQDHPIKSDSEEVRDLKNRNAILEAENARLRASQQGS